MTDARNIRVELETLLVHDPHNSSLSTAIKHLSILEEELIRSSPSKSTWTRVDSELRHLQDQALWGILPEQKHLINALSDSVKRLGVQTDPDISIIMPPRLRSAALTHAPTLPPELLEQINDVYLLHNLATKPSKILPPGKSLLSLLSSRNQPSNEDSPQQSQTLTDKVSQVVTRAFWDEALESLSSPIPAVQLTRIRLLHADLRASVEGLVPPSFPIMYTLSDPLSPTSSPLRSAASHLRELLHVLRERCAPIRDPEIDALLALIHDPPSADLPKACIETVRGIFEITTKMKEDLADFVVGTWTEQDARRWIRLESISRERSTVLNIFTPQTVKNSYNEWLAFGSQDGSNSLVARLLDVLSSSKPVSPLPPSDNMLPAPFFFVAFDLLKVQNLLQALVITASLRTLVRSEVNHDSDWLSRVWILLETEVENGGIQPTETKILNLEDEVVQAARASEDIDPGILRGAVRRILRPEDPVFILLKWRLTMAIRIRLTEQPDTSTQLEIPVQMRSGRGRPANVSLGEQDPALEQNLSVKGFEDTVLKENVKHLVISLREILQWVNEEWVELLATNEIAS